LEDVSPQSQSFALALFIRAWEKFAGGADIYPFFGIFKPYRSETGEGSPFLSQPRRPRNNLARASYFVVGVALVAVAPFTAFLCFFTCFFAGMAEALPEAGLLCAAREMPAVAKARESTRTAEVIFFMVLIGFLLLGGFLCLWA